ncbi:hypothetical protein HYX04_05790 [Candidatus Woesearchaeota archaeon]|nr:hypothetical protein [Candidatus Woesearchaeota archaeon]
MDQATADAVRYVATAFGVVGVPAVIAYYTTKYYEGKRKLEATLIPAATKAVVDYLKSPEYQKVLEARERVDIDIAKKLTEKEYLGDIADDIGNIVDGIIGKPVKSVSESAQLLGN